MAAGEYSPAEWRGARGKQELLPRLRRFIRRAVRCLAVCRWLEPGGEGKALHAEEAAGLYVQLVLRVTPFADSLVGACRRE